MKAQPLHAGRNSKKGVLNMGRNKILLSLLFVASIFLIGGCNASVKVERDSLKVGEALIGHWVNTDGNLDYYFSASDFVKVEGDGTKTDMTYVIVKSNETDNTINIRVTDSKGGEQDKEMQFSTDKKTMDETSFVLGVKSGEDKFSYVDNATKP
jgi:hypothetical protein